MKLNDRHRNCDDTPKIHTTYTCTLIGTRNLFENLTRKTFSYIVVVCWSFVYNPLISYML